MTNNTIKTGALASFVYNRLLPFARLPLHSKPYDVWRRLWLRSEEYFKEPIETIIHGFPVVANYGYGYPVTNRIFPTFNNPLVELTYQSSKTAGRPVVVADVGAAIGDTIILLQANCPGMIDSFYCIDGDPEFVGYLERNIAPFPRGKIIISLLSDSETREAPELVRTHASTASAQGKAMVATRTFDQIFSEQSPSRLDVLKIDVDGFDGKVLAGATESLSKYQPNVIFEWSPICCRDTQNSFLRPFEVLSSLGYERFVWFTKYGNFSHIENGVNERNLQMTADLALRGAVDYDLHYDVIALPAKGMISPLDLAEMTYAKQRPSKY